MLAEGVAERSEHLVLEETRVQELGVRLAGAAAPAHRQRGGRDDFERLGAAGKRGRELVGVTQQVLHGNRRVVAAVDADRRQQRMARVLA